MQNEKKKKRITLSRTNEAGETREKSAWQMLSGATQVALGSVIGARNAQEKEYEELGGRAKTKRLDANARLRKGDLLAPTG